MNRNIYGIVYVMIGFLKNPIRLKTPRKNWGSPPLVNIGSLTYEEPQDVFWGGVQNCSMIERIPKESYQVEDPPEKTGVHPRWSISGV